MTDLLEANVYLGANMESTPLLFFMNSARNSGREGPLCYQMHYKRHGE